MAKTNTTPLPAEVTDACIRFFKLVATHKPAILNVPDAEPFLRLINSMDVLDFKIPLLTLDTAHEYIRAREQQFTERENKLREREAGIVLWQKQLDAECKAISKIGRAVV